MAGDNLDTLATLNDEQQLALQQYASVTNQEPKAALPLLKRCEWNVSIAIARFFDGEPPEPEPARHTPPPLASRRQETLQNSFHESPLRARRRFESAPRIVGLPESRIRSRPPLLLSVLLTPINVLFGVFSRLCSVLSRVFPFIPNLFARILSRSRASISIASVSQPRRLPLGPQATTSRFLREFETAYGQHDIPFLDTSYARAFDFAKADCKFLVVTLLSPEHEETDRYARTTLLAPQVKEYLQNQSNHTSMWVASVADSEPFQVAEALSVTKYPYSVVIAHTPSVSSTAMSILARIPGSTSPNDLVTTLERTKQLHGPELDRARASKADQNAARSLRDEQNSAYERSLAADKERARQRREAEMAKMRLEAEEKDRVWKEERHAKKLKQWKRWRAQSLANQPPPDAKNVVRLNLRLPNGERVTRRFAPGEPLEAVYAFVECHDVLEEQPSPQDASVEEPADFTHAYGFRLVSPMPREIFELADGGTVGSRMGRGGNIIAERIEEDEEDEA